MTIAAMEDRPLQSIPSLPLPQTYAAPNSSVSSKKRRQGQGQTRSDAGTGKASSAFSTGTKEQIRQLDGEHVCWHCGASPIDVCHVVPRSNRTFLNAKERSLLNLNHLSDVDNGIPLCGLCHANFDNIENVGFVFTPEDLPYFIRCEEEDAARRRELRAQGRPSTRICPTKHEYRAYQVSAGIIPESFGGGLYERYTLRDYFPSKLSIISEGLRTGVLVDSAPWHGDPMAALQRTFAVLGNLYTTGIPPDKRIELSQLNELYRRNDEEEKPFALPRKRSNWRDPKNLNAAEDKSSDNSQDPSKPPGTSPKGDVQASTGVAGISDPNEQSDAQDGALFSKHNLKTPPLQDSGTSPALVTPPASLKSTLTQDAHAYTNPVTPAMHPPTPATRWSPWEHRFSPPMPTPATFYQAGLFDREPPSQITLPDIQTCKVQAWLRSHTPSLHIVQNETLSAGTTLVDTATLFNANSLPLQATLLDGSASVSAADTQTRKNPAIDEGQERFRAGTFWEGESLGVHDSNFDDLDSSHSNNGRDIHNSPIQRRNTKRKACTDESSNQSGQPPKVKRRITSKFTVDQQKHLADMERKEKERRRNRDLSQTPAWKWGPWATTQDKLDFHRKLVGLHGSRTEQARSSPKDT